VPSWYKFSSEVKRIHMELESDIPVLLFELESFFLYFSNAFSSRFFKSCFTAAPSLACLPPRSTSRLACFPLLSALSRTTDSCYLKGYKEGLQPESLADGKLAGETKSTSVEN
jgi:hypothetical protein